MVEVQVGAGHRGREGLQVVEVQLEEFDLVFG